VRREHIMRRISVAVAGMAAALVLTAPASSSAAATCPKPPELDPATFVSQVDNPYFPLTPGTTYRYTGQSDGERTVDVFSVTAETKVILGVTTTVVRDQVFVRGKLAEDTQDWFAQDTTGTVWYFGEDTKEYESGVVVSTEGSWEAGVDDAQAGIFMPAAPAVGQSFHQEFAKGVAEDCFKIVDLNASVDVPYVSSDQALKTEEWTRLDPGLADTKYYVAGIGLVRDVGATDFLELASVRTR
jgi:hypothetical protein